METESFRQRIQKACSLDIPYELPLSSTFVVKGHAAVAVVFAEGKVLLVHRSPHGRHAGQMAFPGGYLESPDETAELAARRETLEEVGLDLPLDDIAGTLPELYTFSSELMMRPIVFVSPQIPGEIRLQTHEIESAVWVEWNGLTQTYRMEWMERGSLRFQTPVFESGDPRHPVVWGATAVVLKNLMIRLQAC